MGTPTVTPARSQPAIVHATSYLHPVPAIIPAQLRPHLQPVTIAGVDDYWLNPATLLTHRQPSDIWAAWKQWRNLYTLNGILDPLDITAGFTTSALAAPQPDVTWAPDDVDTALTHLDTLYTDMEPAHTTFSDEAGVSIRRLPIPTEPLRYTRHLTHHSDGTFTISCPEHTYDTLIAIAAPTDTSLAAANTNPPDAFPVDSDINTAFRTLLTHDATGTYLTPNLYNGNPIAMSVTDWTETTTVNTLATILPPVLDQGLAVHFHTPPQ